MSDILPEGKCYCRKCQKLQIERNFYDAVDLKMIDSNGKMSVCKSCIQKLYDEVYGEVKSMERTIHRLCIMLNIRYSNDAVSATRAHMDTLIEGGKVARSIFGLYKSKLVATNKSMDKSIEEYEGYEDVGVIFEEKEIEQNEIPIPKDVIDFWGKDLAREDILYLEEEYKNFKTTHKADAYAEVVLLKQVCYTMLDIKKARKEGDNTDKLVKELQELMKNLAIAPKEVKTSSVNKGEEAFGLWIADIERSEPAQWLLSDPRGDAYRDVADTDLYFENYITRPLKNFITQSRDFNIIEGEDGDIEILFEDDEGNKE